MTTITLKNGYTTEFTPSVQKRIQDTIKETRATIATMEHKLEYGGLREPRATVEGYVAEYRAHVEYLESLLQSAK